MINTKFEAYKIAREIKRSGSEFVFKRKFENKFGEPLEEEEKVGILKGLYHEQNSNIQIQTGEVVQYRTKKIPMILCLYEDYKKLHLEPLDYVCINGAVYKVSGAVDIQNWNVAVDISLEVVDDGIRAQL